MKNRTYLSIAGLVFIILFSASCTKDTLPDGVQLVSFSNANDPSRIEQTNNVLPLRAIKGGAAVEGFDYVFTEVVTIGSPEVNAVPVQASHIRYYDQTLVAAYNTEGDVCAGGWEVLDVTDPAVPVPVYNTGLAGAEYSSVDLHAHPVTGLTNALFVGSKEDGTYYEAFLHAYELQASGIPSGAPTYRSLDGFCGTDVSRLGIVTGTGGKFYLLNGSDYLAPAVTYDLADARSCAYDETTGKYVALLGQPGRLVTGLPDGTIQETALGGLSFSDTKAITRIFNNRAYVALGDGGLAVVDLTTQTVVSTLAAPVAPLGANTQNYVTNGVSVTPDGLIFIANGAAGVYVAREDRATNTIEVLGFLDLNSSVNFVESHGEYLFVATGEKGISIIHINGLRSAYDSRDGQWYKTVMIGSQVWMAENIRYHDPVNSLAYDNNETNVATYGRLYNATGAQTACPPGWRLPSHNDFRTLELYLGMNELEVDIQNTPRGTAAQVAYKLMSPDNWTSGINHNNSSGFSLYGCGLAGEVSPGMFMFSSLHLSSYLWTSEADIADPGSYFIRYFMDNVAEVVYVSSSLLAGSTPIFFSVRCVKDN